MTNTPDGLDEWVRRVSDSLNADGSSLGGLDVQIPVLLDLARDAAHGVARPAAPVTTFLLGYAAGRSGADAAEVRRLATLLAELAGPGVDE
ncbi:MULTISPECIES: DUF6457 domain-containing protein [unclassified Leifsonia]|uniref:DUF6457 domain-containing protein n=1 Tax=unclassified Leifsonia TaxID=2663824 RepID=UPI0006F7AD15|nr:MULTISPECIES: DUF6457 domain-containing protein [unclassified Leifsonia]KQX07228.1 hypothetical protein ASC59_05390 [Leifsonia sp. Root1293]KRA11511.1 hypothetical protein ASD61_05390 [Leifsonia sp. Root60]